MKRRLLHLFAVVALAAGFPNPAVSQDPAPFPVTATDPDGFAYATPGVALQFPRDHGSHPEFKSEWWYITGHLQSPDEEAAFGFQITFFRSAVEQADTTDDEATQLYMAHAALFDKKTGRFHHEERLNADDWNADAAVGKLDLYNGNWYLRMLDPATESMRTRFSLHKRAALTLDLQPTKAKTLFGEDGYSAKGEDPGAASYYITFTRLAVEGSLTRDGKTIPVVGQAWMDHEFSSSQLSQGQIGWNWTSLQLDDGSELMAYVMRREDGAVDPHSRLTLIDPQGGATELRGEAFSWTPLRHWQSEATGGRYPVEYQLSWGSGDTRRTIRVKPLADDQELRGAIGNFVYWEGAGEALDESGNRIGLGYTELTGYDQSLQGRF